MSDQTSEPKPNNEEEKTTSPSTGTEEKNETQPEGGDAGNTNEQTEPSGERVVTTQGQTFTLKTQDAKTMEEDEEVLLKLYIYYVLFNIII